MARRTFHYRDGKSDKFWSIELHGDAHTVRFGRTGTQGQTRTQRFATPAESRKSHDRLVREKLAKGYVEQAGGAPSPPPAAATAAEPDAAAWREALLCFGVTPKKAADFAQGPHEDIVRDFTGAVLDTPFGVATDWNDSPTTALQFLAEGMEQLGVHIDVEEVDDQLQVFVHSGEGGERVVRRIADPDGAESLHEVIFALDRVLPKTVELYLLVGCEGSDTFGHAVLTAERWHRVRELLGPAFALLFRKQRPRGPTFRRARQQAPPSWADLVRRTVKDRKRWLAGRSNRDLLRKARQEVMDILERRKDSPLWERHWTADRRFPEWRESFLASFGSPRRFDYIQGGLDTIVRHLSTQGAVRVLGGHADGWPVLRASVRYDYYRARIRLAQFTRLDDGKRSAEGLEGRDWALLLSKALAIGETEAAEWCGRQALRHPRAFGSNHTLTLQPFMIRLYALWKKAKLDARCFAQAKLGAYREVIDAWDDEGRLAVALTRACDYHARQARHDHTISEFTSFPSDLFPAEILAVYRVRRDLRLPTPDVQHPILSTSLARPPAAIPSAPDDVLDRLMTAVEEELPSD